MSQRSPARPVIYPPLRPPPWDAPWAVAHRGASATHPENTAAAFDAALAQGADGMELDLQLSADGVGVVYHNKTLDHAGLPDTRVDQLPWAELKRLDAGGWFAPEFKGEPLLTLDDLLDRYGGKTVLLLEIKARQAQQRRGDHLKLARIVANGVARRGLEGSVVVLCFHLETLMEVHRENPRLGCVWNLDRVPPEGLGADAGFVSGLSLDVSHLTGEGVALGHGLGLPVMAWVCDTDQEVKKACDLGVEAVMSNKPGWLKEQLAKPKAGARGGQPPPRQARGDSP